MNLDETMKENYTERYKRIAQTEQFKKSYCDKSLGKEAPASEDLEEACDNYYDETWDEHGGVAMVVNNCHDVWFPSQAMSDFFKAGAEWQHGKDFDDLLQSEMQFPKEYYEKGKSDMREEMMKDALDGCVSLIVKSDTSSRNLFISTPQLYKELQKYNDGDKVKIIIIKNEQQ